MNPCYESDLYLINKKVTIPERNQIESVRHDPINAFDAL